MAAEQGARVCKRGESSFGVASCTLAAGKKIAKMCFIKTLTIEQILW